MSGGVVDIRGHSITKAGHPALYDRNSPSSTLEDCSRMGCGSADRVWEGTMHIGAGNTVMGGVSYMGIAACWAWG